MVGEWRIDGVKEGHEELFPDPLSAPLAESWRSGAAKTLAHQNAVLAKAGRS